MALTGKLGADFSAFDDAVRRSEAHLTDFAAGADRAGERLNRMIDQFQGKKVIQDATLMAEAVERVGGAAKLTDADLAKIGKTVDEASAHLRAMGADVPEKFTKITEASHKTEESLGLLRDAAGYVTTAVAGMFTAEAIYEGFARIKDGIIEITHAVMEYSITLRNLSLQTGIGITELQVLGAAVKDFGVDSEQLGRAIFQMGRRIAGGDESAANALHMLGLSIEDVKGHKPEEFFLTVERAIAKVPNAFQTSQAAAELFGARLGASLIAASYNVDETVEEIKKLNTTMSPEAVHAAAEFSESVDHLKLSLLSMAGNALLPAMGFMDRFVTNLSTAQGRVEDLKLALIALAAEGPIATAWMEGPSLLGKIPKDINLPSEKGQIDPETFMLQLRKDALLALTPVQESYLAQLREMGQLTEKNASALGVNANQFKNYVKGFEDAKKAAEDLKKTLAEADAITMMAFDKQVVSLRELAAERMKAYGTASQIQMLYQLDAAEAALMATVRNSVANEKDRAILIEGNLKRHIELLNQIAGLELQRAGRVNAAIVAELNAQVQLNAEYGRTADGQLKVVSAAETLRIKLHDLHLTKVDGISQAKEEQVLIDEYTKALYNEAVAQDKAAEAAANHAKEVTKTTDAMKLFADGINTLAIGMRDYKQFGQPGWFGWSPTGASPVFINPTQPTFPTNAPPGSGTYTPPVRDFGGPVSAGNSYIIGLNREPELFTPGASGFVSPLGGSNVNVRAMINIATLTPTDAAMREELRVAIEGLITQALGDRVHLGGR